MIKANKGEVKLTGLTPVVMAEFSCIVEGLYGVLTDDVGMSEEDARERIQAAVDAPFELEDDPKEFVVDTLKMMIDMLESEDDEDEE